LASSTASAQEPGLEGRSDVVLWDGFESPDWYTAWGRSDAPRNTSLESDDPFRGDSHLRVQVPEGEHYGTSFGYDFPDMGMEEPEEVHFRYAVRLGPTWTTQDGGGGKLPGFGGTHDTAGWGGRPSDGTNGWSARMLFWQPGSGRDTGATRIGYYVYHADMTGTYGDNWFWSGGPIGSGGVLETGRWYQVECYVHNNTPGENDGILRGWVDGEMVYEKTDVRFRDVARLGVEKVWFDLYYGGSWTAPDDMYVDFDNVAIAWAYIGPVADEPPPGDDAGPVGGDDAGPTGGADAGSGDDAGSSGTPDAGAGGGDDDGGGSCAVGPVGTAPSPPLLALLLAGLWLGLRRRR